MFKSVVYQGNCLLGEAEIYPQNPSNVTWMNREIRISHFSPPSDRCPPLAVLHTIATAGVCFRMESKPPQFSDDSPMFLLHTTCLRENKTAVVSLGDMELHLVAMPSRKMIDKNSCFWGFNIARGLYHSCIIMMNLRCLGIVFDLDETLIVANTMRSFEDRIDVLQRKINSESDPLRVSGMLAEVKRYQDDKSILKQYAETDQVFENGKVYKVQSEVVPPFSEGQQPIIRPLIRLQEKNIILTRVNPGIRDTSVLVRVRPAWEELRSYLTAKGRKRFEVYVCTMAERDYALEMWRLLDPESNLINTGQLLDRIVCVKSGLKKSLLNVFQNAICHPRMALVIDDRLKVWDDRDQPRVHVVPAYAPYYAPQAETNNAVPVLHVARNVACNVRGNFFKEFDEGLLPRVSEVYFEDDMTNFPSAPDVGNYLITEDDTCALNGNKESLVIEGVIDVEAGRRLKETSLQSSFPVVINNFDPRLVPSLPHAVPAPSMAPQAAPPAMLHIHKNHYTQSQSAAPTKLAGHSGISDTIVQSSPAREEGEVPESELDPDTRRRLLILQHGQDIREHIAEDPPLPPVRPPLQGPVPTPQGSWLPMEGEMSPRQLPPKEYPLEPEGFNYEKKRSNNSSFFRGIENSSRTDRPFRENQRFPKKAYRADHRLAVNRSSPDNYDSFPAEEMPSRMSSNKRDTHFESKRSTLQYPETPAAVLEEIASKCGAKVEYKTTLVDTRELQFSVQVLFIGEKVSEGIGKTRKEAQRQAAEDALMILANKYISDAAPNPSAPTHGDLDKLGRPRENGFGIESNCLRYSTHEKDDILPNSNTSENSQYSDSRLTSKTSFSDLKELCTLEGLVLVFQPRPSMTIDLVNEGEIHVQAEVDGQVLGKGTGMTWEEAKLQASEEALMNLKSSIDQVAQKHAASPRSWHMPSNKRLKAEFSQSFPRTHSSRYS